jgi:hypothetical protein
MLLRVLGRRRICVYLIRWQLLCLWLGRVLNVISLQSLSVLAAVDCSRDLRIAVLCQKFLAERAEKVRLDQNVETDLKQELCLHLV